MPPEERADRSRKLLSCLVPTRVSVKLYFVVNNNVYGIRLLDFPFMEGFAMEPGASSWKEGRCYICVCSCRAYDIGERG